MEGYIRSGSEDVEAENKDDKKQEGSDDEWDDCDVEDGESDDDITEENKKEGTESFSEVSKPNTSTSKGFSLVDKPDTEDFCGESVSSIVSKSTARKGLTREEAFLGLNIKKAEIMPTGEIKLGTGKIIGHRKFHYLYK